MEKEVKIQVPEGYVIDEENSTFKCIKFKKKSVTFTDIANKYENEFGFPVKVLATSHIHMHKIIALNKLMIVAKYLNDGWIPDFDDINEEKNVIVKSGNDIVIRVTYTLDNPSLIYFKTMKLARQAIDILGEQTIREAINNYY